MDALDPILEALAAQRLRENGLQEVLDPLIQIQQRFRFEANQALGFLGGDASWGLWRGQFNGCG
jgi:hypothetical protein